MRSENAEDLQGSFLPSSAFDQTFWQFNDLDKLKKFSIVRFAILNIIGLETFLNIAETSNGMLNSFIKRPESLSDSSKNHTLTCIQKLPLLINDGRLSTRQFFRQFFVQAHSIIVHRSSVALFRNNYLEIIWLRIQTIGSMEQCGRTIQSKNVRASCSVSSDSTNDIGPFDQFAMLEDSVSLKNLNIKENSSKDTPISY